MIVASAPGTERPKKRRRSGGRAPADAVDTKEAHEGPSGESGDGTSSYCFISAFSIAANQQNIWEYHKPECRNILAAGLLNFFENTIYSISSMYYIQYINYVLYTLYVTQGL